MEFGNKQFKNLKIISSTSSDGTVILDINMQTEKIAIVNGFQKSTQNQKKSFPMLYIYSSKTALKLQEFILTCEYLKEIKFSLNGNYLVIYGLSNEIIVKCMSNQNTDLQYLKNGHQNFIEQIAMNQKETILISASPLDCICIWSLENFTLKNSILMNQNGITEIYSLAIAKNDIQFAAICDEDRIAIWERNKQSITKFIIIKDGCNKLEYHTNSNKILLAYRKYSNSLLFINITNSMIIRQLELFSVKLSCINFKNNYETISISQNNIFQKQGCISQWNWVQGTLLTKQNYEEAILSVNLLDEEQIIISKIGSSIKFWV